MDIWDYHLYENENHPKVWTEVTKTLLPPIKFFTLLAGLNIWIFLRHLPSKWDVKMVLKLWSPANCQHSDTGAPLAY